MSLEENIKNELVSKFAFLEGKIASPRPKRIFLEVPQEQFRQVFDYAVKNFKFAHLCTITGLDESEDLGLVYHLADEAGILFNLKTKVSKDNPQIKTITDCFPSADIYERELVDLLGVKVSGLIPGNRYPLTDDWPKGQYPLRKDWKLNSEVEKEGDKNA